jgi:transcriptional regulator of acetoin/glycerol metabolism
MMVDGIVIDVRDLPESIRGQSSDLVAPDETMISLQELQQRHTIRVLERVGGNKSQAAEILGISRATIYQLLAQARLGSSA